MPRKEVGHNEIMKPQFQSKGTDEKATAQQTKQELVKAVRESTDVLVEITTPLQLFPVSITLDRAKLVVTKFKLFKSTPILSLSMEDVQNVTAHVGIFFGTIKIDEQIVGNEEDYIYGHFWRQDALRLTNIAKGFIIALQKEIDMSPISSEELADMLNKIGMDEHIGED